MHDVRDAVPLGFRGAEAHADPLAGLPQEDSEPEEDAAAGGRGGGGATGAAGIGRCPGDHVRHHGGDPSSGRRC